MIVAKKISVSAASILAATLIFATTTHNLSTSSALNETESSETNPAVLGNANETSMEENKTFTYPGITPYETQISNDLFNNVSKPFITQTKGKDKKTKHQFTATTITSDSIKIDSNRKAKIMLNLVKTKDKNQKQKHKKIINLKKGTNIITGLESGRTYQIKYGYNKKTKKYSKMKRITPLKETAVVSSAYIQYTGENTGMLVKNIDTHWSMGAEANRKIFWRTGVLEINAEKAQINPMIEYNYGESHSSSNEISVPDRGFLQVDFVVANPISVQTQRMWSVAPIETVKESKMGMILLTSSIPDMQQYADIQHGLYTNKQLFELSDNSYKTSKKYLENALNSAKAAANESINEYNGVALSAEKAQINIDQAWFWLNQAYSEIMITSSYVSQISSDYKDYASAVQYRDELSSLFNSALAEVQAASAEVVKAWVARSVDMLTKAEDALNTNQPSSVISEYATESAKASRAAETEAQRIDLSKTGVLPKNLQTREGSEESMQLETPLTTPETDKESLMDELKNLTSLPEILDLGNGAAQLAYSTYVLQLGREGVNTIMYQAANASEAQVGVNQVNQADATMQEMFLEPMVDPFKTGIETYLSELINLIAKANEHYNYVMAYDEVKNQRSIIENLYREIQEAGALDTSSMSLTELENLTEEVRTKTLTMRDHIEQLDLNEKRIASNSRHKTDAENSLVTSQEENDESTSLVNQTIVDALASGVGEITTNNTAQETAADLTEAEAVQGDNTNFKNRINDLFNKKLEQEYTPSNENAAKLNEIDKTHKLATIATLTGDVLFEETKAENTSKAKDARINVTEARSKRVTINSLLAELEGTPEETQGNEYLAHTNQAIVNAENYAMASQELLDQSVGVLTEVAVTRDDNNVWFTFEKNSNDTREAIDYAVEVVRSGQSVTVDLTPNNGNYLEDLGNGTIKVNVKNLPGNKEDGVFFRVVQESWERTTQNPTRVDPQEVSLDGLLTMEVSSSDNYTCETAYAPGVLDGSECVDTKELSYDTRAYTYPTMAYTYTTRTVSVYGHYDWNFSWGHCTGEGKSGNWPNGDPYCQTPVVGWHDVTETVKNSTPSGYVDNGSVWVSESPAAAPGSGASIDPYFTDAGYVDNGSMYVAKSPKPASIHNNAALGLNYNYEPAVNKYQARTLADIYSTYKPAFNSLPSTVLSWEANDTEYTTLEGNDTGRNTVTIKVYTLTGVKYITGSTDSSPRRP